MGRRRTGAQFTATVLVISRRAGPKIPARVLVEFHTLLISVRLVLLHVVEPIQSPFLEIEGGPRSESHTTSRSGKQSRLTNPSRFLTVAESIETFHTERARESRPDPNVRGVWGPGRAGLTFDLGKIRRRQTVSGDQMEALHGPCDRDIEQAPFLSLRIPSAHAHGLQYVRVPP